MEGLTMLLQRQRERRRAKQSRGTKITSGSGEEGLSDGVVLFGHVITKESTMGN
jgi:hypothetical protein